MWDQSCPSIALLEDGASSAIADPALLNHLSRCADCARVLEQIRADNALLSELRGACDRSRDTTIAHQIDGYEILGEIERGGQGVVYEGVHAATRRRVALKMLLHGSFATTRQRRRFKREVEIAAALRHPNIVTVYDSGHTAEGHHYLAMEFVEGVPLDEHMRTIEVTTSKGLRQALEIFASICDAVMTAHQRGVIHRDLKPANVLVCPDGQPRVLDFGLARQALAVRSTGGTAQEGNAALGAVAPSLTMEGEFRGTFAYAAPEQVRGGPEDVDTRADVYSLGVILYEMLTDVHPHSVHKGVGELVRAILDEEPRDPRTHNCAIDDELLTIIMTAMAKDASRRYQSAAGLLDDVRHYLADEPINAKRDSPWYLLRKTIVRHRIASVGSAASVVLLVSFGILMAMLYRRAVAAERDARLRERDLEQVAGFQAQQLSAIDVTQMGQNLRQDLLDRVRDSLERSTFSGGSADADEQIEDFADALAAVDFTSLALKALDENIFEHALVAVKDGFGDQPLVKARLLHTLGAMLIDLGLYERAIGPLEEAIAIRRRELGDDDPDTLATIDLLTQPLSYAGRAREAEPYAREALEGRRRVLGNEHESTISSINALGLALHTLGRFAEAAEHFRDAMMLRERVSGPNHPGTIMAMGNLGLTLESLGLKEEAEVHYREALRRARLLVDDGRRLLWTLTRLGTLLRHQGRLEEAEPFLREAAEGYRRVLGEDHSVAVHAIYQLGLLYQRLQRWEDAERIGAQAVSAARRGLPYSRQLTAFALLGHAQVLAEVGRFAEAEREMLEAHTIFLAVYGDREWRTVHAAQALADLYSARHAAEPDAGHDERAAQWRAKRVGIEFTPESVVAAQTLADSYDFWHATQPDRGHDKTAAFWRAKIEEIQDALQGESPP